MAKSEIEKSILREINTAKYEQIVISTKIKEEIEWQTNEDKQKEMDRLTEQLLQDFIKTYNEACSGLGIDRCIGSVSGKEAKIEDDSVNDDDEFDILD